MSNQFSDHELNNLFREQLTKVDVPNDVSERVRLRVLVELSAMEEETISITCLDPSKPEKWYLRLIQQLRQVNPISQLALIGSGAAVAILALMYLYPDFKLPFQGAELTLTDEHSVVVVVQPRREQLQPIVSTGSTTVEAGDEIFVRYGSAQIQFTDQWQTTIEAGAKVSLEAFTLEDGAIKIAFVVNHGQTFTQLDAPLGKGDSLNIRTPSSSATATGTSFIVHTISESETYYAVSSGKIQVFMDEQSIEVSVGEELLAIEGTTLTVRRQQGEPLHRHEPQAYLTVNLDSTPLYASPDLTSAQLGFADEAENLLVLGQDPSGTWYLICCVDDRGWAWVKSDQVTVVGDIATIPDLASDFAFVAPVNSAEEIVLVDQIIAAQIDSLGVAMSTPTAESSNRKPIVQTVSVSPTHTKQPLSIPTTTKTATPTETVQPTETPSATNGSVETSTDVPTLVSTSTSRPAATVTPTTTPSATKTTTSTSTATATKTTMPTETIPPTDTALPTATETSRGPLPPIVPDLPVPDNDIDEPTPEVEPTQTATVKVTTTVPTATSILPTATETVLPSPTPTKTATDTPKPPKDPTATPVPPTATSIPPTATPVPPTATSIPPTATPVPPTATSIPPTATPIPPTATSIPPTATPISPTATSTPKILLPTDTPTPQPTETNQKQTPVPEPTDKEDGTPTPEQEPSTTPVLEEPTPTPPPLVTPTPDSESNAGTGEIETILVVDGDQGDMTLSDLAEQILQRHLQFKDKHVEAAKSLPLLLLAA